jgi:hypothetical protein
MTDNPLLLMFYFVLGGVVLGLVFAFLTPKNFKFKSSSDNDNDKQIQQDVQKIKYLKEMEMIKDLFKRK